MAIELAAIHGQFPPSPSPSPAEITEGARAREASLSRLLMAFISSGLVFMVLPGTFLGVWNLLQISGRESVASISPSWIQAHGHAQVFGWIGSFIFGIGFYSIPKLRGTAKPAFKAAWTCWVLWTVGVAMRCSFPSLAPWKSLPLRSSSARCRSINPPPRERRGSILGSGS